jgi:bacterioferritin-associated ferredoxin
MIVCSCNVISDLAVKDALTGEACPKTPGGIYKCLGCKTSCGRCIATIKGIIAELSLAEQGSDREMELRVELEDATFEAMSLM